MLTAQLGSKNCISSTSGIHVICNVCTCTRIRNFVTVNDELSSATVAPCVLYEVSKSGPFYKGVVWASFDPMDDLHDVAGEVLNNVVNSCRYNGTNDDDMGVNKS